MAKTKRGRKPKVQQPVDEDLVAQEPEEICSSCNEPVSKYYIHNEGVILCEKCNK